MKTKLISKFDSLRQSILHNSDLESDKQYLEEPELVDNETLSQIKSSLLTDFKITLNNDSDEVLSFFTIGASISWTHSPDGGEFLYGGFKVNGLWDSLVLDSDFWKLFFSIGPDKQVPDNLKHFEKLNWFEQQAYSDDGRFGCFIREKGVFPPKVAFYDEDWYMPMKLTFEEYWDALFASCAVKGWQYFYVDINKDMPHWQKGFDDMVLAVKYLPQLFPEMDFSFHKKKLEEARKRLGNAK